MKSNIIAGLSGLLFAVGLAVSGMTLPSKVIGFLDFLGNWDPSLLFVMASGLVVFGVGSRLALRRAEPVTGGSFEKSTKRGLDAKLIGGSALFGLGWGIAGFCPGPAIVSVGPAALGAIIFVGGMVGGQLLFEQLGATRPQRVEATPEQAEIPAGDQSLVCG